MSWRAWITAILGIAATCWIVSAAELFYVKAGFLQLPPAALVLLGLLLGLRWVIRNPKAWLNAKEITTLYCMFVIAALVASRGLMEKLISLLVAPSYFARPANHWAENFFPFLRKWSVAFDPQKPSSQLVSKGYYEGLMAGQSIPWMLWLRPLLAWAVLIAFVFGAFLCLAILLRRPWVENERLAFPLVRLPQEMIEATEGTPFWRKPMLSRLGFAIPTFIYSLNSLQAWFPSLPTLPLFFNLNDGFTRPPWNSITWTPVVLSFAAIGLLYLVPLELLFSLWFFFLFSRLAEGTLAGYGVEMPDMPYFPCRLFVGYQVAGAYIILAIGYFRTAWPYWKTSFHGALHQEETAGDLLSPRLALLILGGCLLGMSLWSSALGLSFGWALLQWVIYLLVVCLVMARSVSEGGLLMTETSFRPVDLFALIAPVHSLGRQNLVGMAMLDSAWYRDQRGLILTGLLDAMKMGSAQKLERKSFLLALILALGLATVCSAAAQIWLPYHFGALQFYGYLVQGNPTWFFDYYTPHMSTSSAPGWQAPTFFGIGTGMTMLLIALRARYVGWPLQPLGYALSGSWTMILLWFPCLLVWVLKGAILRYGGRKLFHQMRPLFLGLILGEFTMAVFWSLLSAMAGIPAPIFPWP